MKLTLDFYDSLMMSCTKISDTNGNIPKGETFTGFSKAKPTVYTRFMVGTFNTNLVAKILEGDENGGKFLTLSGSIYEWKVINGGDTKPKPFEIDIIPKYVDMVDKMVKKYDNMNKLIDKM